MGDRSVLELMSLLLAVSVLLPIVLSQSAPIAPQGRPVSSPIVIDGDPDLVQTASDLGWAGDGSLSTPFMVRDLTIDASGKGACLYLGNVSKHVLVLNCSFRNAAPRSSFMPGAGIVLWETSNISVQNCSITDNLFGIYSMVSTRCRIGNTTLRNERNDLALIYCDRFVVENNTLTGSDEGFLMQSSDMNDIKYNIVSLSTDQAMGLYECKENRLIGNRFHNNTCEVYVYLSESNLIERNEFDDDALGLKVSWSPYNTVNRNTFRRNDLAFQIVSSRHNSLGSNTFMGNIEGVHVFNSDYNKLTNSWIADSERAVHLESSHYNELRGNLITEPLTGIDIEGDSDRNAVSSCVVAGTQEVSLHGIRLRDADGWENTLYENTVSNCGSGILIELSDRTLMDRNIVSHCSKGFDLQTPYRCNLTNNQISDCSQGVSCDWSPGQKGDRLLIEGNIVRDCLEGIKVQMGPDPPDEPGGLRISGNRIDYNSLGLYVGNSFRETIEGNYILENDVGLLLAGGRGDLIYDNYLNNDENVILLENASAVWNESQRDGPNIIFGPYIGGNYWSDYTGSDLDGDGFGDEGLPHGPGDRLPLVRDTSQPRVEDITSDEPRTGEVFNIVLSLDDRPAMDLEVEVDYELLGPEDTVIVAEKGLSWKHWKENIFGLGIQVPERSVKLLYSVFVTDRGGNTEGLQKERMVKDTIAPQVTIEPVGSPSTGGELWLNVTVIENTFMDEVAISYGPNGTVPVLAEKVVDLNGSVGPLMLHLSVPVGANLTELVLVARAADLALNSFISEPLIIEVVDTIPPVIDGMDVDVIDEGLRVHFRASIGDNIAVASARIEVRFQGDKSIEKEMSGSGAFWEAVVPIPLDASWGIWAITAMDGSMNKDEKNGRFDCSPIGSLALLDRTNGTPATGGSFLLSFEERGVFEIGSRRIDWWFETAEPLTEWGVKELAISVPESARVLHYRYTVKDIYGSNASIEGRRDVSDILLPGMILFVGEAFTGMALDITWNAADNIAVRETYLTYSFNGNDPRSMELTGNVVRLDVPDYAFTGLFIGHVLDLSGNENTTTITVPVVDNIPPVMDRIASELDEENGTFEVSIDVSDNRGLEEVKAIWSFEGGAGTDLALTDLGGGAYHGRFDAPGKRGRITIEVTAVDTSGNEAIFGPYTYYLDGGTDENGGASLLLPVILLLLILLLGSVAGLSIALLRRGPHQTEE